MKGRVSEKCHENWSSFKWSFGFGILGVSTRNVYPSKQGGGEKFGQDHRLWVPGTILAVAYISVLRTPHHGLYMIASRLLEGSVISQQSPAFWPGRKSPSIAAHIGVFLKASERMMAFTSSYVNIRAPNLHPCSGYVSP